MIEDPTSTRNENIAETQHILYSESSTKFLLTHLIVVKGVLLFHIEHLNLQEKRGELHVKYLASCAEN